MKVFASFNIFISYFVKMAMQLLSQSFPMEIKVPLFNLLKLYVLSAFQVNLVESGRVAFSVGAMILSSAITIYSHFVACIV